MTQSQQPVSVELASSDDASQRTRDQLLRLLEEHDLERWIYTGRVVIDRTAIPRSHPVLTLHTRHLGEDDLLLATFLHEQLHWFLFTLSEDSIRKAFEELQRLFPKVPVGFPEGAEDEESTHLHLIVNYLELLLLREVLGVDRARDAIEFWATDHYRWVYRTVLEREADLRELVVRHEMLPSGVAV